MPDIVLIGEARDRGLVRYYTGKACKHGHVTERQTSSKTCMACDRAAYEKRAPKRRVQMRAWQNANRERMRELSRAWKAANPDWRTRPRRA